MGEWYCSTGLDWKGKVQCEYGVEYGMEKQIEQKFPFWKNFRSKEC